jgi:hypothetical protein
MSQGVAGAAPSGEYTYFAYVGDYELQEKIDSSYFSLTKSGEVRGLFTAWDSPGELFSELQGALVPSEFNLAQNYPNPFNAETEIRFCLKEAGYITSRIYNLSGQEVKSLLQEKMPAGNHRMIWEGKDNSDCPVSSGVYFCCLRSCGSCADIKRMVLLK